MANILQFWDWLENRRSKDNKVSGRMWKIVEIQARKEDSIRLLVSK